MIKQKWIYANTKRYCKGKGKDTIREEEALHGFDIELANHELMVSVNKGEDKILSYINEIDKSNDLINEFKLSLKKLRRIKHY